jgi:hypothetical protein
MWDDGAAAAREKRERKSRIENVSQSVLLLPFVRQTQQMDYVRYEPTTLSLSVKGGNSTLRSL